MFDTPSESYIYFWWLDFLYRRSVKSLIQYACRAPWSRCGQAEALCPRCSSCPGGLRRTGSTGTYCRSSIGTRKRLNFAWAQLTGSYAIFPALYLCLRGTFETYILESICLLNPLYRLVHANHRKELRFHVWYCNHAVGSNCSRKLTESHTLCVEFFN